MAISQRLQHDTAFALATALLEIVQHCIREEERRDAFDAFYEACRAGIEAHDIQRQRMHLRLHPFNN
jgi:hypothetical protein